MNINECIEQLNSLLEHFENGGNDFNATDVIAIKSLLEENERLKAKLKNKPDTEITLQDDKGNKFMLIQTERIDMQERLNKTIERLFNNWNKLKEHFSFLKINSTGGNKEFIEDIILFMQELEQGSDSNVKD